jgi:type I restriction enzyme, S subunit
MDVEPGYMKTEVWALPSDWNVVLLADIAPIVASGRTRSYSQIGDYIVYGSTGILGQTNSPDYMGRAILVARVGANAGKLSVVSGRYGVSDNTIIVTVEPSLSMDYVWRQLEARRINTLVFGSGQPLITGTLLKSLKLPLPIKVEQEAIAEVLSDADGLIEYLEQLLTKKRHIRLGAMQELLSGKKRLPGFDGQWERKRLGSTALLKARIGWQGLTTAEYLDFGDYYLVTGTEFKGGSIDWTNCSCVDEFRYHQDEYIQLKLNDVLVTKDGTIGKVALVSNLPQPATLNSGVFVIRPIADAFHPQFFYYVLRSKLFTDFLAQLSAGSTISHLYQKDFVHFVYRTPASIEEQIAIATLLADMDAEITALEEKLAKVLQIKQGIMQELLTGRIRLV